MPAWRDSLKRLSATSSDLAFAVGDRIKRNQPVARGIADDAHRVFAAPDLVDFRSEHFAKNQNASVGRPQMLPAPLVNRPRGFPRHVVLHPDLLHFISAL